MTGAFAAQVRPNYQEKQKSIIVSIPKVQKENTFSQELKRIDSEIKILEDKYVTAVVWKNEEERKKNERLILDHYILKTNKNIKNLESNLELNNYQGKTYYYGLTDFIEFCSSYGYCVNKIEKLYLDKMYLYAIKTGRINQLKEIEEEFTKYNFARILIQKSLNKATIAINFKRIYIHDIIESIKKEKYDEAIDKVVYYSSNIIRKYLGAEQEQKILK